MAKSKPTFGAFPYCFILLQSLADAVVLYNAISHLHIFGFSAYN